MSSISHIHDHCDRDAIKERAEADFLNLFDAYGGRRRGKALLCPFHEDRSPSASIFKGRFRCFGCGVNIDVIGFVAQLEHSDFKSALASLSDRYGVVLRRPMTTSEKRDYARRRAAAEQEGAELVNWKESMLTVLREVRDVYLHSFHRCQHLIAVHSLEDPRAGFIADAADRYRDHYEDSDRRIERINRATFDELLPLFRARGKHA